MSKQDRQGVRTAIDLEQRYRFGKTFSEQQAELALQEKNLYTLSKEIYSALNAFDEQITNVESSMSQTEKTVLTVETNLDSHTSSRSNPHSVTASQIGLGNVDNTSDANKPVSTAQASAIADAKSAGTTAQTNLSSHTSNKNNPHGVTASQVGARPSTWMPSAKDVGALAAIQDTTYKDCYYRMNGSTKEWINPPHVNGVEYLTIERFLGLQVFTKTVEVTMSNGGTITLSGASKVIRVEGFVQSRGTLPIIYADLNNAYAGWLFGEAGKVTMKCGSSVAGKTAWITAYYTKS